MGKYKNKKLTLNAIKKNVSGSMKLFKDRKLEDLVKMFGKRGCNSMYELNSGWQKTKDDRETYTWPISPELNTEMKKIDITFTAIDSYDKWDNVYFECGTKVKSKDVNIQAGEGVRAEFQDALNRKQNELMNSFLDSSCTDEFIKIRTARKRGRHNKYYNQIDEEDYQG